MGNGMKHFGTVLLAVLLVLPSAFALSLQADNSARLSTMQAPASGYYAFKMNWFRSTASTNFFNARDEIGLAEPASAGATSIRLTSAPNPQLTYLIYNPDTNKMERLDIGAQVADSVGVTLRTPLQNGYEPSSSSRTKVVALVGSYWGYCPSVISPVNLGYYNAGETITIGEITNYYNDVLEPKYTSDQNYFYVERPQANTFRVALDEGKHLGGWLNMSYKLGFDDGTFGVYLVSSPIPSTQIPLPVHSSTGEPFCGTLPANRAPTVSGVSGPSNLQVGEQGTWSITATDPEGSQLSYSVLWGDETSGSAPASRSLSAGQTATFTHVYYSAGTYSPTFTVSDNVGLTAQTSASVQVGRNVCAPVEAPLCPSGYEQYKYTDENGCVRYGCRQVPASGDGRVEADITPYPSQVNEGEQFRVVSTIAYYNDNSQADSAVRLKVVTRFDGDERYMGAASGRASGVTPPAQGAAAPLPGSSASATSVADAASARPTPANGQERVDYISLGPGGKTQLTAYFVANKPGTHAASVYVYKYGSTCPPAANPPLGMVCREDWVLSASSSANVYVSEQTPPPVPSGSGTIVLYSGWNMISVPVDSKVKVSTLASECGAASYAWKLKQNGYEKASMLEPGTGYWLKASRDCKFQVSGGAYSDTARELFAGWNLVAASGAPFTASDNSGSCSITSGPWYYSTPSARVTPYVYSPTLEPGRAYWVKVPSACRFGSSDDKPPAPPA